MGMQYAGWPNYAIVSGKIPHGQRCGSAKTISLQTKTACYSLFESFFQKVIRTQESLVRYITFDGIYFYTTHTMDNLCGYFIIQTIFLFSKMTSEPQIWTPDIMTFLHSVSIGKHTHRSILLDAFQ